MFSLVFTLILLSKQTKTAAGKGKAKPANKNNANKQKQKRKQPARATVPRQDAKVKYHLSKCAEDYMHALANPFSIGDAMPCVPDLYDAPSKKVRTRMRGTLNVLLWGLDLSSVIPSLPQPVMEQLCDILNQLSRV